MARWKVGCSESQWPRVEMFNFESDGIWIFERAWGVNLVPTVWSPRIYRIGVFAKSIILFQSLSL